MRVRDVGIAWGYARVLMHIALGTVIVASYFPFASVASRERLIRWWSRIVLGICGLTPRVAGAGNDALDGTMLVMNHISWIDIYVVHAHRPVRFVAKSEIRAWPVIGYLCDRTGTIFIERGRRRAVHQANQLLADVLRQGGVVAVFPEGTTSDGSGLLPFHANLIQAAIEADRPVQPAALRYRHPDGSFSLAPAYIGEMTLLGSLRSIFAGAPVIAEITFLPRIATTGRTRHELAAEARAAIAASLGVDIADRSPDIGPDLPGELL